MVQEQIQRIDYIIKTSGVLGGRACLAEPRIPVWQIALLFVRQGLPVSEIVSIYTISPAQVHAALAYYYDHQTEIEQEIEEAVSMASHVKKSAFQQRIEAQSGLDEYAASMNREMTTTEVAEKYNISPATVRQTILRGAVAARKSGGTWLIQPADAEKHWGDR